MPTEGNADGAHWNAEQNDESEAMMTMMSKSIAR